MERHAVLGPTIEADPSGSTRTAVSIDRDSSGGRSFSQPSRFRRAMNATVRPRRPRSMTWLSVMTPGHEKVGSCGREDVGVEGIRYGSVGRDRIIQRRIGELTENRQSGRRAPDGATLCRIVHDRFDLGVFEEPDILALIAASEEDRLGQPVEEEGIGGGLARADDKRLNRVDSAQAHHKMRYSVRTRRAKRDDVATPDLRISQRNASG